MDVPEPPSNAFDSVKRYNRVRLSLSLSLNVYSWHALSYCYYTRLGVDSTDTTTTWSIPITTDLSSSVRWVSPTFFPSSLSSLFRSPLPLLTSLVYHSLRSYNTIHFKEMGYNRRFIRFIRTENLMDSSILHHCLRSRVHLPFIFLLMTRTN